MITTTTTDADGNAVRQDFAWSFSAIRNFETCAHRYQQVDLLKNFSEPPSRELREGLEVHTAMAKRLTHATPLPVTMPYEHWIQYALKDRTPTMDIQAEQKLAITADFQPCTYFDKTKPVYLRTVADVLKVDGESAHILDWKTGKVKPELDQLLLAGLCVLVHYPQVMNITGELIWLGFNTKTTMECGVDDLLEFWNDKMQPRVEKFQRARSNNIYPKKPSGLCRRWCMVTTCEHCGQ
jgi:PD-(D/E)XK nuclease superfamily